VNVPLRRKVEAFVQIARMLVGGYDDELAPRGLGVDVG
jgi:hypothetical protein